jgi:hypothetical protein
VVGVDLLDEELPEPVGRRAAGHLRALVRPPELDRLGGDAAAEHLQTVLHLAHADLVVAAAVLGVRLRREGRGRRWEGLQARGEGRGSAGSAR